MSTWIWQELRLLGISVVSGILLRACYDLLLIHRELTEPGELLTGIGDVLFWIFCCIYTFCTLYYTNNGIVRGFILLGMLFGMLLYHRLVSPFLVKGMCRLCRWMAKLGKRIVKKLCRNRLKIRKT